MALTFENNDREITWTLFHETYRTPRYEFEYEMSTPQTNQAFVPDDDKSFSPSLQSDKEKHDAYTLDLRDMMKPKDVDNYDPYKHRTVEHPTTNSETLFHLLKGSLGTGILAMPNAFFHAGYALGFFGTIIIGLICTYCIHLLIGAEYELCKRKKIPSLTYTETTKLAFADGPTFFQKMAPYSGHMVNTFLLVYQLGTCCVYIVFIASNIKSVVDQYGTKLHIAYFMLMFLLPLIFINWIKNLKLLAPFSTGANFITFVSFGIIIYYLIDEGPTFKDREAVGHLEQLPLFFGTVLFALEAIGVIMPLENEMKTPKSFGRGFGVLNIGMSTIIFLYVGMGLLGYLSFGETQGSITLDLPPEEILAQVVKVTLALAIFITYALQCYVAVDITWNEYLSQKLEKSSRKTLWEYATRTALVIVTFLLAVAIPELDLFISLFGALCLSALGIAIPALVDLCTYWNSYTGSKFYLIMTKNVALVVFALFGLVVGTATSLQKIIEKFV